MTETQSQSSNFTSSKTVPYRYKQPNRMNGDSSYLHKFFNVHNLRLKA